MDGIFVYILATATLVIVLGASIFSYIRTKKKIDEREEHSA